MTEAERFREVDRLFKQVCDLEPGAREQRLIELAPGDERLRSEVIELLEAEARADASRGLTPEALQAEISAALGGVEDPVELAGYRVLSRLGAGGMGVVYEAEQRSPRRTVALKVLRPGLATPDLVRRFEFEAEALGRLRHPGIAQVYEAGVAETDAGPRPFFAMELVRGAPLDRWARETGASPRQRLEMMARVCDAVQHAHAQGVIHRDLKPANILVTPEGEAKVLDFGVARTIDAEARAESVQTMKGQLVGTLPYMSPEQLSGEPAGVDTRCDVYALGVVLFELMSGRLPHDVADRGLIDAARTIQDEEPTRLATLEPRLRGDVDTIAGTALRRDKERRYQTAAAMGDDIRRHLAGLTIAARPPSAVYQLSRLARRHVPAVVAACVVLVALVGAVVGVSLALSEAIEQRGLAEQREGEAVEQTELAERRRIEAERQTAIAQGVTGFLNNDVLAAAAPSALGHDVTVRDAMDAAADKIGDRFADEPATGAAIRNNIANVYTALGEFSKAEPLLLEARDMFAAELGGDHELTRFAEQDVGKLYSETARYEQAREALTALLAKRDGVVGPESPETLENIVMLAELERDGFGDITRARELLDEYEARAARAPDDEAERRERVGLYAALVRGGVALVSHEYETAAADYKRVAEARAESYGEEHPATLIAWHNYAVACEALGRYDEAEPIYTRGLEIERERSGPDNPNTLVTAHNLAFLYESMGRHEDAEPLYLDTLERCRRVFGPVHPGTLTCTQSLSSLYRETGRIDEAADLLAGALEDATAAMGPGAMPVIDLSWKLAVVQTERGEAEDGEALIASAVGTVRGILPEGHPQIGAMLSSWGECLARMERHGEAAERLREAYAILEAAEGVQNAERARVAAGRLGESLRAMGEEAEAERWEGLASVPTGGAGD